MSGQSKTGDLNGSTCVIASGQLLLGGLRDFTLTNGTIKFSKMLSGSSAGAFQLNENPSNLRFTNLILIGSSPTPGVSAGEATEHNHAFWLQGVQGVVIDRVTISKFGGDCVYSGGFVTKTWTHNLTFTNSICTDMGRMGVAAADGLSDALIENNTFDRFGWYQTFDLEPNCVKVGTPLVAANYSNIIFRGNKIGRGNSAKYTYVLTSASCSGGSPGSVTGMVATGNRTMYPDTPWNPVLNYPATLSDNK